MNRCLALLLCFSAVTAAAAQSGDGPPDLEQRYYDLLNAGRYDLARKMAIAQFRPDLHCAVYLHEAAALMTVVERSLAELETAPEVEDQVVAGLRTRLIEARALGDRALAVAEDYVVVGLEVELGTKVRKLREEILGPLGALEQRVDRLGGRAKSLNTLLAQDLIGHDDLVNLEPPERLICGLHLADRGRFDEAIRECFVPLRLESDGALQAAARCSSDVLEKWNEPALENRKWSNLVESALDACDGLREAFPQRPEVAGWMMCLAARLARDHYDVPPRTIHETLLAVQAIQLPAAEEAHLQLLRAKLAHERFLLQRRDELWNAEIPSARHFDLFRATHSLTYAAEAAMIAAAAAGPQDSGDWQGRAAAAIDTLQAVNEPLAESLRRRLERYDAIHQPFERWLEIAQRPDYRDTRGTVLPDVLLETRGELIARVRRGFEEAIGAAIIDNQLERGFQLAQQAKALAVGRTLTAEGGTAPEPITVAALLRTRLMSFGLGDGRSIPSRELFIEYFFGPARAWAFYIFAPGDVYQPLMVVELDRAAFDSQCREAIRALQAGHAPEDPGRWLLSGSPDLKQLWGQLEADKQRSERMPRLVISPDGPLCFLPLQAPDLKIAASVVTLPTAAVLFNSRYLDARRDAVLMWECQRGDLTPEPAWLKPVKGSHFLVLWPGAELEIKMGDE